MYDYKNEKTLTVPTVGCVSISTPKCPNYYKYTSTTIWINFGEVTCRASRMIVGPTAESSPGFKVEDRRVV